ncbi:glutathione S-transferase family protein [Pelomonas sp. KK5]|uniref:glutathione S-transferase family protein n=1 Tax=Pelomonas sp. KK5 TaxID=1855730 RepID=UPI00097C17B3|nr:glutathione S-transferase family protein [Pelomonas sp. KK5]
MHSLKDLVNDARAALNNEGTRIGPGDPAPLRFELFSAANSICSQKVRAVLAQCSQPYRSHMLDIFAGDSYLPAYVRLRLVGCDAIGAGLVNRHSGSTSVAAGGGCDAAVVPTLVDWQTGEVVVDSKRICLHIDAATAGCTSLGLRPDHLAARIDAELDTIDNLPNYQMLNGLPPSEDRRPGPLRGRTGVAFAMSKVERCERLLAAHADDEALVRAYTAKRAKELDAAQQLFDAQRMRDAYARAEAACEALERKLQAARTRWLLDEEVTMADVFWGVELARMANLGADSFWIDGTRPALAAYADRTRNLDAIRQAVIDWPGACF